MREATTVALPLILVMDFGFGQRVNEGFNKQITIFVCELQFCYGSMTRGNYKFEWVRLKALS
jgi:hypothetical protein